MNTLALQTWWKQLPQRDRTLLALWMGLMGIGALAWCWSTLQVAQANSQALLAAERQTLGAMRMQVEELQRLRQLPAAGGNVTNTSSIAMLDSLSKFGLPHSLVETQSPSEDRQFNLQGTVPFDRWVEWVAFVQKDMRLELRKARVTRGDRVGIVNIQATLEAVEGTQ